MLFTDLGNAAFVCCAGTGNGVWLHSYVVVVLRMACLLIRNNNDKYKYPGAVVTWQLSYR